MTLRAKITILTLMFLCVVSACNLTSSPEEQQLDSTDVPTNMTIPPTRTLAVMGGFPTTLPLTPLLVPTTRPGQLPPTTGILPATQVVQASTSLPVSIVILSPVPGNVVAGNVQILGAAIHPQFLQYHLEYGPDPNPGTLWFPATGAIQNPVLNGLLGIWNTTAIQDGVYQLRLRLVLRDGTSLATVVNNIRIQNRIPTPVPSATPNIPRPIAAFTQSVATGQVPLTVRFTNQSVGTITTYRWDFGDGTFSQDPSPTHIFSSTGIFNVILTVTGPGGASNVSRQINIQSPSAPVAGFTQDKTRGIAPLNVQFTDQSSGSITGYNWNFGDGSTSTERSPLHNFINAGTYNIILTVNGPGGSSIVTGQVSADGPPATAVPSQTPTATFTVPVPAAPTNTPLPTETPLPVQPVALFTATASGSTAPVTVQFSNQSTGEISSWAWDFGDGNTSNEQSPLHEYTTAGTYVVTLTVTGPGGITDTEQSTISVAPAVVAPTAAFSGNPTSGAVSLPVQFTDESTGDVASWSWNFGDGGNSSDQNPAYTFNAPGDWTVTLTVTASDGVTTSSAQATISVAPAAVAPTAVFSAIPTSGTVSLSVQFTDESTGDVASWSWNFGDGGNSSDQNPAYTFNAPGDWTVTLTVTASDGVTTSSADTIIAVSPAGPPPDGSHIVFAAERDGNSEIYVMNADGTNIQNLSNNSDSDSDPVWSSNGSQIAFVSDRDGFGFSQIYIMNTDGSGTTRISDTTAEDYAPAWSPNGQIAFVSERDGSPQIYVMNADGSGVTKLSDGTATDYAPTRSSGGQIAFVSERDGLPQIYVMNADGSGLTKLSDGTATDYAPAWSPNNQIAFVSERDGFPQIYVMNADGSGVNPVSDGNANDSTPAWWPNGNRITFVSNRDGNNEIYVMNGDGTTIYRLTNNGTNDNQPAWAS